MNEPTPLETIFFAALERSPDQRAAFLVEACAGDEELRQRIERMLAAQDDGGNFLETPPSVIAASVSSTIAESTQEKPGSQIGPYKLLQQIGEGGMGTVFMAEQTHPVQRKVALKVIKPGMDTFCTRSVLGGSLLDQKNTPRPNHCCCCWPVTMG